MLSGIGPTDDFWLTAHDGVRNARVIGDRPLGIGLATGLLGELVRGGWCQLWDGRLFRRAEVKPPADHALLVLLDQMQVDETDWPPLPPKPPRATPPPPPPSTYREKHALPPQIGDYWPPSAQAQSSRPPVPKVTRPPGPGHDPRQFMSWLAYDDRAAWLVGDRLTGLGIVRREERRRMLGGKTVRYVPYSTVFTGNPASKLTGAVQQFRADLDWSTLFYARLLFATGLHQHALFDLTPSEHSTLRALLQGLDETSRELLDVAELAVGNAAAIR